MLSLLSRITHHPQSSFLSSTASPLAVLGRVNYSSLPQSDWTPTHRYSSKGNETRARRIATDPDYHERKKQRDRLWYKNNTDQAIAYSRRYDKENPQKRQATLEKRRPHLQRYLAARRSRWASDHHFHQRGCLRSWIRRHNWVRDLVWPTHNLIYTPGKILRHCAGCEHLRPLGMWWQDKKTGDFLCHPCFTNDWSRALPIGHENKVFGRRKPSETKPGSTTKSKP